MGRFLFLVFFLLPGLGSACSCVHMSSGCDRSWIPKETAFLGRVIALEETRESGFLSALAVRFEVNENFSGATAGAEVTLYTGIGGGDCGYPFVRGESYLVYAAPQNGDGRLHTGICSETTPAVRAGGVLPELRAWRDHKRLDDLFGAVLQAPRGAGYGDLIESKTLAGVTVRATEANGRRYGAMTDAMGAFAFPTLPAGTYKVQFDLPSGLISIPAEMSADLVVDGSGCALTQAARPDGRIEGVVVDGMGNAKRGFVTIQPADPQEASDARRRGGLPGDEVGADGKFVLPLLPPGRYRLVFNPAAARGVDFRTSYYWPEDAEGINVELGQHIAGLRFVVKAK